MAWPLLVSLSVALSCVADDRSATEFAASSGDGGDAEDDTSSAVEDSADGPLDEPQASDGADGLAPETVEGGTTPVIGESEVLTDCGAVGGPVIELAWLGVEASGELAMAGDLEATLHNTQKSDLVVTASWELRGGGARRHLVAKSFELPADGDATVALPKALLAKPLQTGQEATEWAAPGELYLTLEYTIAGAPQDTVHDRQLAPMLRLLPPPGDAEGPCTPLIASYLPSYLAGLDDAGRAALFPTLDAVTRDALVAKDQGETLDSGTMPSAGVTVVQYAPPDMSDADPVKFEDGSQAIDAVETEELP